MPEPPLLLTLAVTEPGRPEIFLTLQGEGASAGCPAVFVRLSQCNLQCWWCDTPYTWNFDDAAFDHRDPARYARAAETEKLGVAAVAEAVLALDAPRLVLTGGEPMLQARSLAQLCETLKAHRGDLVIEIETNGTIAPTEALGRWIDRFNVSPKLASSRNAPEVRRRMDVLSPYAVDDRALLKLVIADDADLAEADALIAALSWPRERVYLMPEGVDTETLERRGRWLAGEALSRRLNFTPRLHVSLYGAMRGA